MVEIIFRKYGKENIEKIEKIMAVLLAVMLVLAVQVPGKCVCPIQTAGDILRIFRQWQIKGTVENTE